MTNSSVDGNNINWIECNLIPELLRNGKFSLPNNDENLSETDIKIKRCDVRPISTKDAFMLTNCYKVKVYLTDLATGTMEHIIGLVVKITPSVHQDLYDTFDFDTLFKNEINAYEVAFPALKWTEKYPKYFYSHVKPGRQAVIALADFTEDGFSMSTKSFNLTLEHIIVAAKEIGKFHGEFYALKHSNRRKFDFIKDQFEESRFRCAQTSFEWDTLLRTGPKRAVRCVRHTNATGETIIPERFLAKLEKVLADPFNYQRKMVQPTEPIAILCHGDYLRNNLAFYYSSEKDEQNDPIPLKAMIFDFQTIRYSSPMVDLACFMFNSTGQAVRRPNFSHIFLAYYHQVIENFCTTTGVKQNQIPDYLSYENFLHEYAAYMPYGLSVAASFLPVLHVPHEFDMDRTASRSLDEIATEGYERGGANVDAELRALVVDMYNLYHELQLDLVE